MLIVFLRFSPSPLMQRLRISYMSAVDLDMVWLFSILCLRFLVHILIILPIRFSPAPLISTLRLVHNLISPASFISISRLVHNLISPASFISTLRLAHNLISPAPFISTLCLVHNLIPPVLCWRLVITRVLIFFFNQILILMLEQIWDGPP